MRSRINDISFLVFSKMRTWSSEGQRRKLGAHTMAMFSTLILVTMTLSSRMNFWNKNEGELGIINLPNMNKLKFTHEVLTLIFLYNKSTFTLKTKHRMWTMLQGYYTLCASLQVDKTKLITNCTSPFCIVGYNRLVSFHTRLNLLLNQLRHDTSFTWQ